MKVIGHRGAMGLEPENTLRSFHKALAIGVDGIEFDVHYLSSGELVIIHDDDVDRTTNGHGRVEDFSFEELRRLDAGNGQKIPTLQEALDLINRRVWTNIELKGPDTVKPVREVITHYINQKGWQRSDFSVSSFLHNELREFKKAFTDIDIAVLIDEQQWKALGEDPGRAVELAKDMKATSINPSLSFVSPELVKRAHDAGMSVNVYTLVENRDVSKMLSMSVDGIYANFPDRAKEVLKR